MKTDPADRRLEGLDVANDEPITPNAADAGYAVRRVTAATDADIRGLAEVLIDCVEAGASVSFMSPLSLGKAIGFWRSVAEAVANGKRALLVAEDGSGIVGTVQLILDLPENQPHRADLSKMLVHRRARRRGAGAAILRAAEEVARELGKTLLVLDTASADAERLYARQGWVRVGVVPGYALWPTGGLCDTTFFYRLLEPRS
jgi:GNAT superfamily N-acetyltransferase